MPSDPIPLRTWPNSGAMANIPFAFKPVFDARLGTDGVTTVEIMEVYWSDLEAALVAILGYSYRDTTGTFAPYLRRKLPWQHPYFNQLWVKNVSHVTGVQPVGNSSSDPSSFTPSRGGAGPGYASNFGPWSEFSRANITIQFQRPNYFVRNDQDILNGSTGKPQEWLRYLDKDWKVTDSILSRDAAQMVWSGGGTVTGLPGGVGQVVTKMELRKRWYELPEAAIFSTIGSVPIGIPTNLAFTQTETINPITGFVWSPGSAMMDTVNTPIGGGASTQMASLTSGSQSVTGLTTTGFSPGDCIIDGLGGTVIPTGTYIVTVGVGSVVMSNNALQTDSINVTVISDPPANRMYGCPMGTLLYRGMVPNQRPLQLPPYLMAIPYFANNEAIAQVQYDVDLVYVYFDPPTLSPLAPKGHNLMPWPRDNFWRPVNSQASTGIVTTPFQYADPSDVFVIL